MHKDKSICILQSGIRVFYGTILLTLFLYISFFITTASANETTPAFGTKAYNDAVNDAMFGKDRGSNGPQLNRPNVKVDDQHVKAGTGNEEAARMEIYLASQAGEHFYEMSKTPDRGCMHNFLQNRFSANRWVAHQPEGFSFNYDKFCYDEIAGITLSSWFRDFYRKMIASLEVFDWYKPNLSSEEIGEKLGIDTLVFDGVLKGITADNTITTLIKETENMARSFFMLQSKFFNDSDVVRKVLNYSGSGAEEGVSADYFWYPLNKEECLYAKAVLNGGHGYHSSQPDLKVETLNLNNVDPRNIKIGMAKTMFSTIPSLAVQLDQEKIIICGSSCDADRLSRGWSRVYVEFCSGKSKDF